MLRFSTGQYVMSGNHDGSVTVWDTLQPPVLQPNGIDPILPAVLSYQAHDDTANGIRSVALLCLDLLIPISGTVFATFIWKNVCKNKEKMHTVHDSIYCIAEAWLKY